MNSRNLWLRSWMRERNWKLEREEKHRKAKKSSIWTKEKQVQSSRNLWKEKISKRSRKTLNLGRRQRKQIKNWNSFLPQVDVWKARVEATSRWSQIEQSWDDLDGLRNGSNSLDFNEFLRLMRLQREEELLRNSGLISIDRNVSVSMHYAACWSVCFGVLQPYGRMDSEWILTVYAQSSFTSQTLQVWTQFEVISKIFQAIKQDLCLCTRNPFLNLQLHHHLSDVTCSLPSFIICACRIWQVRLAGTEV